MKKFSYRFLILSLILIVYSCATFRNFVQPEVATEIPKAEREFRAAWVATVANIDWPSEPGLPVDLQKQEIIAILDTAKALNLNAIVFQIRPHCDAFYASKLEPWSYYLTGEQGKAPDPYYDPLKFWIDESHKRGLELHAWFNPYRAHHPAGGEITEHSIIKQKPSLAKKLKSGFYWLDPANPKTQQHSMDVIMDVVRRYDIDGVHMDDYFYPYPSYHGKKDFPDEESWQAYKKTGGKLFKKDWRRKAVNDFVENLYNNIKAEKKHVKLGISPFGIWRPNFPRSIKGFDQYDKLYADARLWLREGWVDYFTPQLYWPISQIEQSFPVLLGWWHRQNIENRNLWPGLYTSKVQDSSGIDENINQIMITRGIVYNKPGHVHFSMKAFLRNDSLGFNDALRKSVYRQEALIPASPWLDKEPPAKPIDATLNKTNTRVKINWKNQTGQEIFHTVVYTKYGEDWQYRILPGDITSHEITSEIMATKDDQPVTTKLNKVAITCVDRNGNESDPLFVDMY